ncbi:MAG: hypothetical protein HUU25_05550 [Candidatus Sumerlaeia bacterium]|nr:hypothetical protein [Candidatus Sumerlaeia bacterium]
MLIDLAIARGGRFYLTCHCFATRGQLMAAYPELPEILRRKNAQDPESRFDSDWLRHLRGLLA